MAISSFPKGSQIRLSEHYIASDFDCHCKHPECTITLVDEDLVLGLDFMCDHLGDRVVIISGHRCKHHQAELKETGFPTAKGTSTHELGEAADGKTGLHTGAQLEEAARKAGFKAVGVGRDWVHVDTRRDRERRWTYPPS